MTSYDNKLSDQTKDKIKEFESRGFKNRFI
jgi:hypothetical protein